jgi:hypothetical protein
MIESILLLNKMYQIRFLNNHINKIFPLGFKNDFFLLIKNAFPLVKVFFFKYIKFLKL